MKIDGKKIAEEILDELKLRVKNLKEKGITPTLAIILVGDNPESKSYVEQKELKGNSIGINISVHSINSNVTENELLGKIKELNDDSNVHGIIVQRPLPNGITNDVVNNSIKPEKDVDSFGPSSPFNPPIAEAVIKILDSIDLDWKKKNIVIIGKGETGGGPIIKTFEKNNISFTAIDSKTENPRQFSKLADVIISAVGKRVIKNEDIKKGAVLVSVGISTDSEGKMKGDYSGNEIKDTASYYTPTPGGVGPVNVAMLLKNLVEAAENSF